MKILPYEDFKAGSSDVFVDSVSVDYFQEPDCEQSESKDWQKLTLKTENNGTTRFITMETTRWAFDEIDDIINILEDFKKKAFPKSE